MNETSETISSAFINLHYEGEQIKNHTMDWYEFSSSVDGLSCLLKNIAETLGISEDQLKIKIGSIQDGGLKTKIFVTVCIPCVWLLEHLSGYALDNALDALHADKLIQEQTINIKNKAFDIADKGLDLAADIIDRANTFINNKLDTKNENNPVKLLAASKDSVDTKIMKNPQNHKCLEQFVECLSNDVDKLEYTPSSSQHSITNITFTKKELPLLNNPIKEKDEDKKEEVSTVYVILRLEGSHLTGEEWSFVEVNKSSKKKSKPKKYKAEVYDPWLLKLGRENALATLKDIDLYCEMLVKRIIKDKRDTIKRIIIKCSTEKFESNLFDS